MTSYGELLKQATAAKRAGDLIAAVEAIDQALSCATPGEGTRPPAWKKRIYYLLLGGKNVEAMNSAEQLIREARQEACGDEAIVGTRYSFAFQERARVFVANGETRSAMADFLRASWHWQQAMVLQERAESEFPPDRVAESLMEAAEACGYDADVDKLESLVSEHLGSHDPEVFVSNGLALLDGQRLT